LGLDSYLAKLLDVCKEEVEVDNKKAQEILAHKLSFKRKKKKLESAENHDELVEEQEKLFNSAKEFNSTTTTPMGRDANDLSQNFMTPTEHQLQMFQMMQMQLMQNQPVTSPFVAGMPQQMGVMDLNEWQQLQQMMAIQAMQQQNMPFMTNFTEMSKPAPETLPNTANVAMAKKDDDELSEDFEKYD